MAESEDPKKVSKVYCHFEGTKHKMKLPKKWITKPVKDILEFFVEMYNAKNAGEAMTSEGLALTERSGTELNLNATIGDAVQDCQDLFVAEKKKVVAPFVQAVLDGSKKAAAAPKSKGFNYSKWDNLDLSDDEKDFHPNIDNNLMIRLKREKRETLRHDEDVAIAKLKEEGTPEAKEEIARILEERAKRGLCGDDLCKDGFSHTAVNAEPSSFEKLQIEKKMRQKNKKAGAGFDSIEEHAYTDFKDRFIGKMEKYAAMRAEDSEDFIMENPEMLQEEAAGHMLMHMLDLEMSGENFKMKTAARQYLMLQNILDLSKQSKMDPRAAVKPFFREILQEEKMAQLRKETEVFAAKISKRAIDKKAEMEAEEEEEEEGEVLSREERLGPGGLDPVEVFESLPESMQAAFESKEIPALLEAVKAMPEEEAAYHMKRCEDSGLWVPNAGGESAGDEGPEDVE